MRSVRYALACAVLCMSFTGKAEVASTPASTVQLSKVILNPQIPATSQHVKVGTICLFAGSPLDFGTQERTLSYERFERLFSATMQQRGFNVLAKSSNLFEGEGGGAGPDFLFGATFRPQSVDICDSVNGQKGIIAISVEWQIYDRSKRQVVETATTRGSGELPKFQHSGLTAMIDQAFSASLTALIDQGVIQKYVGNPAPREKAPSAVEVQKP